ncbi:MAG: HPF/RaiA family ribosome-associated protein [Candidatus Woesearchaeota archaeon]
MPRLISELIQYKGINLLNESEKSILNKLSSEYYEKIRNHFLKNTTKIEIHIKAYDQTGERKKFSVDIKVISPTRKTYVSNKSQDWDFARAIHKAFRDLENQIKKDIHKDESHPRPKHIRK